jgi:hypothetical protein
MDMDDLNERVVGFLTLAYNTRLVMENPEHDETVVNDEFIAAKNALLKGLRSEYSLQRDLGEQIGEDIQKLLIIFSGIFIRISYALEDAYPEIDIPAMLQKIALESANGTEP